MDNREKVIAGFEDSLANNGCGFMDGIGELFAVSGEDLQNALALLKAQQEPTSTPEAEWLLYKGRQGATCSFCKHTYYDVYDVENYDYYCRHCGAKMVRIRTVKWE